MDRGRLAYERFIIGRKRENGSDFPKWSDLTLSSMWQWHAVATMAELGGGVPPEKRYDG